MNRRSFVKCIGSLPVLALLPNQAKAESKTIVEQSWHRVEEGWRRFTPEGYRMDVKPIHLVGAGETDYPHHISEFAKLVPNRWDYPLLWHARISFPGMKSLEMYPFNGHAVAIGVLESSGLEQFLG